MNFQQVRNANGQNVKMSAIATAIDGTSYIPSGTPKQNCKFTDANGERQSVTIWQGKGQPIPLERQGQTLSINISCKPGNQGRINYGGFWMSNAQVQPINPSQGQQGVQQAAGQPNAPQVDLRSTSIERQCAFKAACNRFMGMQASAKDIVEVAKAGQYFIETGNNLADVPDYPDEESQLPPNPGPATPNPAMGGSDNIPF